MPRRLTFNLESLSDTNRLAAAIAGLVRPGDVVLLSGELGAGKTTLVRAISTALGVPPGQVSSPTFTIMNEYTGGRIDPVIHMDAYRLTGTDESELFELGWDDAVRAESVAFIEWGERIDSVLQGLLKGEPARFTLAHADESTRTATLDIPDSWSSRAPHADLVELAAQFAGSDPQAPGFPFASERDQLVDLYHWFGESYRVSRPIEQADLDD